MQQCSSLKVNFKSYDYDYYDYYDYYEYYDYYDYDYDYDAYYTESDYYDCGDAGDGDVKVTLNANDRKPEVRARRVHWKF